jgi:hypothetical protein
MTDKEVRRDAVTGGCQCGAVRYAMHVAEVEKPHLCHCRMCQKATGGLFAALAGCPRDRLEWTRGAPAQFASSSLATRGFCRECGTPLTFAYNQPEARIYVAIGSLDQPERARPIVQYGVESRLSWAEDCLHTPGERTGADPAAAGFFDGMVNNQA